MRRAFELILCREPGDAELERTIGFLDSSPKSGSVPDPLASLCLVLLNTNEFVYIN